MRSFINAHRKSDSADLTNSGSGSRGAHTSNTAGGSTTPPSSLPPQRRSIDNGIDPFSNITAQELLETTPPPSIHRKSISPSKHSPTFESFQRLANKTILTAKLFKRTSNSNLNGSYTASANANHGSPPASSGVGYKKAITHSPPSSHGPVANANDGNTLLPALNSDGFEEMPAIKGTITHSWGSTDLMNDHTQVIKLNEGLSQPVRQPKSKEQRHSLNGGREEVLDIKRDKPYRESLQSNETTPRTKAKEQKYKNRQARIHSDVDFVNFKNTVTDKNLDEISKVELPQITIQEPIKRERTDITRRKLRLKRTQSREPASDEEEHPNETLSGSSDEESTTDSEFSFEVSKLNGRTSSVKYYPKPEDEEVEGEKVYIDDLYEDENFDEDMNLDNDNILEELKALARKSQNVLGVRDTSLQANDVISPQNDPAVNTPHTAEDEGGIPSTLESRNKNISKYDDLFDLSDDENNENTSEDISTNTQAFRTASETPKDISTTKISSYNDLFSLSDDEDSSDVQSHKSEVAINDNTEGYNGAKPLKPSIPSAPLKKYGDLFALSDDDSDEPLSEENELVTDSSPKPWMLLSKQKPYIPPHSTHQTERKEEGSKVMYRDLFELFDDENDQHLTVPSPNRQIPDPLSKDSSLHEVLLNLSEETTLQTPFQPSHVFSPHRELRSPTPQSLPPPARSHGLKYHDLSCNLDSEVPDSTRFLYFIDETEEDEYNNQRKALKDDEYDLDEINIVPEDYEFGETGTRRSTLRSRSRNNYGTSPMSFKATHSYQGKPIGASKETTPINSRLELSDKTVTFFDSDHLTQSIQDNKTPPHSPTLSPTDDSISTPTSNTYPKPSPNYSSTSCHFLSPIQESPTMTNSPRGNK
ncbi:Zrg8p KNAG_0E01470 [Huiozyma naganishii CBS 8797]|uniref:Zinc-regulated protein 8 n=1 Tax=Huiozyma naganishii (strain ATCC MYA-139 / BCRC 22969 / CBS 8797 / KCTC 17520 / NBRC 10181 / NCYC 3082 / Yp74L-3) TaxID=1071383 RepID=J7S7M3_HUIN7|nr:hypothetical protein KNAG_0E01470 [Kazachstania naganishii CBS 8797]CCK70411.1 hypothetical protein KNAG_0E01470 [Kazachstania naganishii CBS 8797]